MRFRAAPAQLTRAIVTAAVAALALPASAAAGSVALWACHGPGGEPLGSAGVARGLSGDGAATTYGSGCDAAIAHARDGGLRAAFSRADAAGGSIAWWRVDVPPDLTLTSVRLRRVLTGFDGVAGPGDGRLYAAETPTAVLESARVGDTNGPHGEELHVTGAAGDSVRVRVACELDASQRCGGQAATPVAVDAAAVALGVIDSEAPKGAVGGVMSPARGALRLELRASDAGSGLSSGVARIDDTVMAIAQLGTPGCQDLSPGDAAVDLALGASCSHSTAGTSLVVDLSGVPDGSHRLRVTVDDMSGNRTTVVDEEIVVANEQPARKATATLDIGSGGANAGTGSRPGSQNGPARASVGCRQPRLSVFLTDAPLRIVRGRPVLVAKRRYRYSGRLTCQRGETRRPAAVGTRVLIVGKRRGRVVHRTFTRVRSRGRIRVALAYRTSRTVVFQHTGADGRKARVRIGIRVVSRRAPGRRAGGGPS
jgi:hypothetical protein